MHLCKQIKYFYLSFHLKKVRDSKNTESCVRISHNHTKLYDFDELHCLLKKLATSKQGPWAIRNFPYLWRRVYVKYAENFEQIPLKPEFSSVINLGLIVYIFCPIQWFKNRVVQIAEDTNLKLSSYLRRCMDLKTV